MISVVIDYLNDLLSGLPFSKRHGLVRQLVIQGEDELTFPAIYEGAGESGHINFDQSISTIYHRMTGETTEEVNEEQEFTGCEDYIIQKTPMRLVAYFSKDVYKTDDKAIELKMAQNLRNIIKSTNINALLTTLQVDYVTVSIDSLNTNSYEIWADEFEGIDYKVPSTHALIAVNYTIEIGASNECFLTYACADTYVDTEDLLSSIVYDQDGNVLIRVVPGNNYTIDIGGISFTLLFGTIPLVGTDIQDKDGNSIGTWIDTSEIFIPALSTKAINSFSVSVDGFELVWDNADDLINTLDDSLTTLGTLKLFSGRDLFQPGAQIKILL